MSSDNQKEDFISNKRSSDKNLQQSSQLNAHGWAEDCDERMMEDLLAQLGFDPGTVDIVRSANGGVEVSLDSPSLNREQQDRT